ncbi:phospholipase D-like domain-containing protein [Gordonia shandongensis]|uniref:phospholipase D-like domain-containing protein n=1 Tax=Gordonia shandongensis TaxID=376351 RepID=UPI000403774C|nr:phospholipase D-like domain-containing protein [Gordonia shandongensis]
MSGSGAGAAPGDLLVAGDTCWRVGRADRVAVIVDAADYFAHARAALLRARRRVLMIGWDFDTRIRLDPSADPAEGPDVLGDLLAHLTRTRPELEIRVLRWSVGALTGLARGMLPPAVQDLAAGDRLHYRVDAAHPFSSSHHQKIVVIDDEFAFCGGIDMTVDRWDTSDHLPTHAGRVTPTGRAYGPWHDATVALDGAAARIVADVARDRWEDATGERLAPVGTRGDPAWPPTLTPDFAGCRVGVSRTLPEYAGRAAVSEIRELYLAAIATARDLLYIESQYLASRDIAYALARRLAEDDGPEVVVVLPRHADGHIERRSMDGARHRLLRLLWQADVHGRFHAYHPVTADGGPIYVHAKVVIVDDRVLRVGSSNLNNRSLGFDSECDVTIDADATPEHASRIRASVAGIRHRLVAEHVGADPASVAAAFAERGSLAGAIASLTGPGRGLRLFDRESTDDEDSVLAEDELLDPERVGELTADRVYRRLRRQARRVELVTRERLRRRRSHRPG